MWSEAGSAVSRAASPWQPDPYYISKQISDARRTSHPPSLHCPLRPVPHLRLCTPHRANHHTRTTLTTAHRIHHTPPVPPAPSVALATTSNTMALLDSTLNLSALRAPLQNTSPSTTSSLPPLDLRTSPHPPCHTRTNSSQPLPPCAPKCPPSPPNSTPTSPPRAKAS